MAEEKKGSNKEPDPLGSMSPPTPKDWPEDYTDGENCYQCICSYCRSYFYGYKRRCVCKKCAREQGIVK